MKKLRKTLSMFLVAAMVLSPMSVSSLKSNAEELDTTEVIEQTTEAVTEVTTEEATEEITEEVTEETTEETTEEVTEEITEEDEIDEEYDSDGITPNYLTFTAEEENSAIWFYWPGDKEVRYSLDNGESWNDYKKDTKITLYEVGESVKFKGKNVGGYYDSNYNCCFNARFDMKGKIKASGSVTSLTDENGGNPNVELTTHCYEALFVRCESLVSAPELPATKLADACYARMFYGCTSLVSAPRLPATTLANDCYYNMFGECTSLVTAPNLPATMLANDCYYNMFSGCTSLTTVPGLPATKLADYCYSSMFSGCTSLVTAPELPATKLADYCYSSMFSGCTSLVTAPELPATILANSCYSYMFAGCENLVSAPELPATILANSCYSDMFYGCTSLVTAPNLPATTLANSCYSGMFFGCKSLKKAPKLPATKLTDECYLWMFRECENLLETPELPATKLTKWCYSEMFMDCTKLKMPAKLPATTLADYCYLGMYWDCTNLLETPELPATKLAYGCYSGMFCGCENIVEIPELPATTLADYCYGGLGDYSGNCGHGMFEGCIKLEIKKTKDAKHQKEWKISATKSCEGWSTSMFLDCPNVEIEEPALGVTYYQLGEPKHVHSYKNKITKATLTKNGSIKKVCTGCGQVASTETIYYPKTISLSKKNFTYNGKAQKPTVSVVDANNKTVAATNYDITYATGLKNVGEYKVTITFKGNYTGTVTKTFTINPKKISLVSVKSKPKQMTVKWKKQAAQVTGYEIQYSTSADFKKGVKKVTVTSAKTTSKTIKKLKSGKKYYVRIRTYKKVGSKKYYSDWSAKKSVKIK